MSGRKKKLSLKLKIWNIALIVLMLILVIFLIVFLIKVLFGSNNFYKVESRKDNIEKSQKLDADDYETIGWLRIQGTNIDYPVYFIVDDTYKYPVTKSFLWSLNKDRDYHNVLILYGHNIMNLGPNPIRHDDTFTRLEEIMSYVYYDFAQENKYIQYTTDGKDYLYKIFAVNFWDISEINEYPEGEFETVDKDNYVKRLREESVYDYPVEVKSDDNVISVVTCTRFFKDEKNYNFIVSARKVRPGEPIENYNVSRNKNYEKVDEMLKGSDKDDKSENV